MLRNKTNKNELYVLANVDEKGDVINFPTGGGSSTKPSIKAHDNINSARRSLRFFPGSKIVKVTGFEIIEI